MKKIPTYGCLIFIKRFLSAKAICFDIMSSKSITIYFINVNDFFSVVDGSTQLEMFIYGLIIS